MENWKIIEAFPTYSVSDQGRVKNNKTGRILRQSKDSGGYAFVCLFNGAKYTKTVHRLVAQAFIPNQDKLRDTNHLNGVKTDNRVENLEWCTHQSNCVHAIQELGAKRGKAKTAVRCSETGVTFPSAAAAARSLSVSDMAIRKCLYGQTHTAGGFHWQYAS